MQPERAGAGESAESRHLYLCENCQKAKNMNKQKEALNLNRTLILLIALSTFCSACMPRSNNFSAGISRQRMKNAIEEEPESQHVLEKEKVDALPIVPWGEEVYNPTGFDEYGGIVLTIRNVVPYATLEEAGVSAEDLRQYDGMVKAIEGDEEILSKELPEGVEWFGMVLGDQIIDEDEKIRDGYCLLMVEADVTNKSKNENNDVVFVDMSLLDRNDLLLYEDPMLSEPLYQMPYLSSDIVYLREAVNQEKDAYKVRLAKDETMRVHVYFFVPEDYRNYIGAVMGTGTFEGGFFSLREDGQ